MAVPHEREDISILLETRKYSLYAATSSNIFDISSVEKLNLELYVAFFKFKILVTPDTGQMQIFGRNWLLRGTLSCGSNCCLKANKQKKNHSCMRSLYADIYSCLSITSLLKHLS